MLPNHASVHHSNSSTNLQQEINHSCALQNAALVKVITSGSYSMCSTLYNGDQDTILKCGHKALIASLIANSQCNLKFDYGFAYDKPVGVIHDMNDSEHIQWITTWVYIHP